MKAVNLIPAESRRAGGPAAGNDVQAVVYGILGVLAAGVGLMVVYVDSGNQIAAHQVQLATIQQQITQTQAKVGELENYVAFRTLAQKRALTVAQIAAGRFDWASAMGQVSSVVPANTTLQALNASLSSSASSSAGSLRSASQGPAMELTGCTRTQVDVARLMSRLRSMGGVTRVTLSSAEKPTGTGSSTVTGCGNGPAFDLIVFFTPPAGGVAATGAPAAAGAPAPRSTSSTPTSSTPAAVTGTNSSPTAAPSPGASTPASK